MLPAPFRRRATAVTAALALATVLAACGGGDDESTTTDSGGEGSSTETGSGSDPTTESPSDRPEVPTSGAIPPNDTETLPEGVDHVTNTSDANTITAGIASTDGEVSVECLGNEEGLVVSLAGTSPDHGDLSAVVSFSQQELTSVVVQSTESPDEGGPMMWMTSAGLGEELTATAVEDGGVWTVTGPIDGFDALTQAPIEGAEVDIVADCSTSDGSGEADSEAASD
ncbi:hypothetical protein ACPYO6_13060 [Georgenia sp. Z1344]|uniref:hypothetical protein n=1 Tax=Georgenia sp. Z1344 TaxID=3416706 RepID=UPI003CF11B7D